MSPLLRSTSFIRISWFNTPSSFYAQLVDEDTKYIQLNAEMDDFYELGFQPMRGQEFEDLILANFDSSTLPQRLCLSELKVSFHVFKFFH